MIQALRYALIGAVAFGLGVALATAQTIGAGPFLRYNLGGSLGLVDYPVFYTPASATAACTKGWIAFDATYIYECTATNTWVRLAGGSTW
jgi:hypothetical protein